MSEDRMQLLGQLCDLLEQHGVVAVALAYEGSGDSGQIDEVEECVNDGSSTNDGGHIDFHGADRADSQDKLYTKVPSPEWYKIQHRETPPEVRLDTLVEHVVYAFLPDQFEVDDGGEGNVLLSVAKRQLALNAGTKVVHWDRSLYEAPKAPEPVKPKRTMANQKSVRKVKK